MKTPGDTFKNITANPAAEDSEDSVVRPSQELHPSHSEAADNVSLSSSLPFLIIGAILIYLVFKIEPLQHT